MQKIFKYIHIIKITNKLNYKKYVNYIYMRTIYA